MKYIKTFNEELSPDIYKNAGGLMKYKFKQNKRGDVLTPQGYNQKLKQWRIDYLKCEIDNFSTHSFRKGFGYHFYKNGGSINLLQDIFNHQSESTTLRYIGITTDNIKDVYKSMNF